MKKMVICTLIALLATLHALPAFASQDQYPGDSSIYGSTQTVLDPNVLIIIDTSGSMADSVASQTTYSSGTTYATTSVCGTTLLDACSSTGVYQVISNTGDVPVYSLITDISNVTTGYCPTTQTTSAYKPKTNLQGSSGQWTGRMLTAGGACGSSSTTATYYYGNYINWLYNPGQGLTAKIDIVKNVVDQLIKTTSGVRFGVMTYNYASGGIGMGAEFIADIPAGGSGTYTTTVQDMDTNYQTSPTVMTNRTALRRLVRNINSPSGGTPLAESLYEAGQYYLGAAPAFGACNGVTGCNTSSGGTNAGTTYVSPATPSCRKNYVVFLTDGMSSTETFTASLANSSTPISTAWNDSGNFLRTTLGTMCKDPTYTDAVPVYTADCDGDGKEPGPTTTFTTMANITCRDGSSNALSSCCTNNSSGTGTRVACTNTSRRSITFEFAHAFDDVAKYLYDGPKNISTFAIGFGSGAAASSDADLLLTSAVDSSHGHGKKYLATDQASLTLAFTSIIANILSVNSSYVAPVVPVSPENRTYGANRVYMGFFKPISGSSWLGNLKKYGIDLSNNVVDTNGIIANYVDINGDGYDDNTGLDLSTVSAQNGTFKATAKSFWSTVVDGATVEMGGAGGKLAAMPAATINTSTGRDIYTLTNTAAGSSLFELRDTTNITPAVLGISPTTDTTTRTKVVNFIYGLDTYGTTTTANRSWFMGDVLHSRPMILNYASYQTCDPCTDTGKCICGGAVATCTGGVASCTTGTSKTPTASETTCATNKTMIYVGGNDGMLHAFKDCDGSEAWAFIPPDLLPNLQNIPTNATNFHPYFVDSTPQVYIYNKLNDGNIATATDKVIMMFGERRGGGSTASTTGSYGSYYVLDVTNPANPTYKYSLSSATTGFSELGETWSEPKIVKMKIGGADKIVAFFGAGYDNINEDMRYGTTQSFSGVTPVNNGDTGEGAVISTTGTALSQRGRGIYAIELATLAAAVPTIDSAPTLIWSYTYGTGTATSPNKYDAAMNFSIPGEIAAIDSNGDGYTDRLYVGDTGGNIWRFDVGDTASATTVASWTGRKIFSSNPSSGDNGRKIFYKPSVVTEPSYTMLFFGTGDREHPKNTTVVDRMYALKDKGQTTASGINESNLYDATSDDLQSSSTTASGVTSILTTLASDTNYGWFIKLETSGEKALASPMVFNKAAYFTTYAPGASTDVCHGDAGNAYEYALNYKTGEAVLNFTTANDSTTTTNARAQSHINGVDGGTGNGGYVLQKIDRRKSIGSGIPSGDIIVINPNGQLKSYTGVGGSIAADNPLPGGAIVPLYWRQK